MGDDLQAVPVQQVSRPDVIGMRMAVDEVGDRLRGDLFDRRRQLLPRNGEASTTTTPFFVTRKIVLIIPWVTK